MTWNEEQLRAALREAADGVAVGDDALDLVRSKHRSLKRRILAVRGVVGVAFLAALSLIAGALGSATGGIPDPRATSGFANPDVGGTGAPDNGFVGPSRAQRRSRSLGVPGRLHPHGLRARRPSASQKVLEGLDPSLLSFSSDGSRVAFTDGPDGGIGYVHDFTTNETEAFSVSSDGREVADAWFPVISGNGRFVAFESLDDRLVPNDSNNGSIDDDPSTAQDLDAFVHDVESGVTTRVSVHSNGTQGTRETGTRSAGATEIFQGWMDISDDGRYVVFDSPYVLTPYDSNGVRDVFLHDMKTQETICVSVNLVGVSGDGLSSHPTISSDGRYVAFHSDATDLSSADTDAGSDAFVRDMRTGTTDMIRATPTTGMEGEPVGLDPAISADGSTIAFTQRAKDGSSDLYTYDIATARVDLQTPGAMQAEGDVAISADGNLIAYRLGKGGETGTFVRDRTAKANNHLSGEGAKAVGIAMSGDGRWVGIGETSDWEGQKMGWHVVDRESEKVLPAASWMGLA